MSNCRMSICPGSKGLEHTKIVDFDIGQYVRTFLAEIVTMIFQTDHASFNLISRPLLVRQPGSVTESAR